MQLRVESRTMFQALRWRTIVIRRWVSCDGFLRRWRRRFCPRWRRADYAVLRSGARLHITGYERDGERVRLTVDGGTVNVAAADLVAVEPEEHFAAVPAAAVAPGPFGNLIHAAAEKHGVDESLIRWVIAVESNFNPRAVSRRRAQGLMQLLPSTAALYAVGNIFDPARILMRGRII